MGSQKVRHDLVIGQQHLLIHTGSCRVKVFEGWWKVEFSISLMHGVSQPSSSPSRDVRGDTWTTSPSALEWHGASRVAWRCDVAHHWSSGRAWKCGFFKYGSILLSTMFVDYWRPQRLTSCWLQIERWWRGLQDITQVISCLEQVTALPFSKQRVILFALKCPSEGKEE